MLHKLPAELLSGVLSYLDYEDLNPLLNLSSIEPIVRHHLLRHFKFHYQVGSLLRLFESLTPTERHQTDTRNELARQFLHIICHHVEECPKLDQRDQFSSKLDVMHDLFLKRILSSDLRPGLEHDYAAICLDIRSIYLHTPSIRVLHDPKYRRRSTKYPLAPFLPRDFTYVWRRQCAAIDHEHNKNPTWPPLARRILDRQIHLRFACFFGSLFEITSLYLESSLDGTFEECVREALVTGEVESLLVMCAAAGKPVDVEGMCMMVSLAGEQLWSYLDTMEDWLANDPNPQQRARMQGFNAQHQEEPQAQDQDEDLNRAQNDAYNIPSSPPPEWLLPSRYNVEPDTKLRLKLLDHLYKKGWHWFH